MTDESETIIETHRDQGLNKHDQALEENEPLTGEEILGWAEFSCWTVVVLIPFLYYANGPAVSFDQLVVRSALAIIAVAGGICLLLRRLVNRRKLEN